MNESTRDEENVLDEVKSRLDAASDKDIVFPKPESAEGYVLDRSKNVDTWDGDNSATKI